METMGNGPLKFVSCDSLETFKDGAVVEAQLVGRLLPIPEVRGSKPITGKIYIEHLFTFNCNEKTKVNIKRPGMAHFLK